MASREAARQRSPRLRRRSTPPAIVTASTGLLAGSRRTRGNPSTGDERYDRPVAAEDRTPEHLTASQRLAAALGRPAPEPLTDAERAALEIAQDRADAEAERIWGVRGQAAA